MKNIQFSMSKKDCKYGLTSSISQVPLFHYLGKVFYSKRLERTSQSWRHIENQLLAKQWRRHLTPKDDLNQMIDNCVLSSSRVCYHFCFSSIHIYY